MPEPDYRKIHALEVELGIVPDEPYGYSELMACENLEELMAAWEKLKENH